MSRKKDPERLPTVQPSVTPPPPRPAPIEPPEGAWWNALARRWMMHTRSGHAVFCDPQPPPPTIAALTEPAVPPAAKIVT